MVTIVLKRVRNIPYARRIPEKGRREGMLLKIE